MEDKIDKMSVTLDCADGATPSCKMIDYIRTEPMFISIQLTVGETTVSFFVNSLDECIAFKDSVLKSCYDLTRRIMLKEEERENES